MLHLILSHTGNMDASLLAVSGIALALTGTVFGRLVRIKYCQGFDQSSYKTKLHQYLNENILKGE